MPPRSETLDRILQTVSGGQRLSVEERSSLLIPLKRRRVGYPNIRGVQPRIEPGSSVRRKKGLPQTHRHK